MIWSQLVGITFQCSQCGNEIEATLANTKPKPEGEGVGVEFVAPQSRKCIYQDRSCNYHYVGERTKKNEYNGEIYCCADWIAMPSCNKESRPQSRPTVSNEDVDRIIRLWTFEPNAETRKLARQMLKELDVEVRD